MFCSKKKKTFESNFLSTFRFSQIRSARQTSVVDIDIDMFLKITNYEDTVKQLDIYYGIGKKILTYSVNTFNMVSSYLFIIFSSVQ